MEVNEALCPRRPVEEEGNLSGAEKTADAMPHEVAQKAERLLPGAFRDQRPTGRIDLEAVQMAVRSALPRAGAAARSELLRFPAPSPGSAKRVPLPGEEPPE